MAGALKDSQVTLRLPNALKSGVEAYAQLAGRSKSHIVMEAVREYLAWRTPQIEDLKAAVLAADAGEFAADDEVLEVFERYAALTPQARGATQERSKPGAPTTSRSAVRSTAKKASTRRRA